MPSGCWRARASWATSSACRRDGETPQAPVDELRAPARRGCGGRCAAAGPSAFAGGVVVGAGSDALGQLRSPRRARLLDRLGRGDGTFRVSSLTTRLRLLLGRRWGGRSRSTRSAPVSVGCIVLDGPGRVRRERVRRGEFGHVVFRSRRVLLPLLLCRRRRGRTPGSLRCESGTRSSVGRRLPPSSPRSTRPWTETPQRRWMMRSLCRVPPLLWSSVLLTPVRCGSAAASWS